MSEDKDAAFNAEYGEQSASFGGGKYRGVVHFAGPELTIEAGSRVFTFEWHSYFGPTPIAKKTGKAIQLGERSPFWRAVELWSKQGKRMNGARAVWDFEPVGPSPRIDLGRLSPGEPEGGS